MKRIRVGIGGNGTVRIKLKKTRKAERADTAGMGGSPTVHPASPAASATAAGGRGLALSHPILSQMEIRVESVFRPKEPDVEVVYALTGYGTSVDHLHKFSSNEVVAHATPEMVSYVAEKMVEHIRAERAEMPNLIVHVHSHPLGAPALSDVDKGTMPEVAARIRAIVPDATVLFGVHAVGSEERRPRAPPERVSENAVRWSSITRVHEVAFFDEGAEPVEVRVDW
jgi:proteasome lid subunit RPN8/RPN11